MNGLWERLKALKLNPWALLKDALKKPLVTIIQEEGDKLQESVKKALVSGGPQAVDKAFDAFQAALKARIEAI